MREPALAIGVARRTAGTASRSAELSLNWRRFWQEFPKRETDVEIFPCIASDGSSTGRNNAAFLVAATATPASARRATPDNSRLIGAAALLFYALATGQGGAASI
jgi:hypothetical protein